MQGQYFQAWLKARRSLADRSLLYAQCSTRGLMAQRSRSVQAPPIMKHACTSLERRCKAATQAVSRIHRCLPSWLKKGLHCHGGASRGRGMRDPSFLASKSSFAPSPTCLSFSPLGAYGTRCRLFLPSTVQFDDPADARQSRTFRAV